MDRAVDVLPEKNKLTVNICSIGHRTRRVAWAVNGLYSTTADGKSRFLALQFDVDGERLEPCSVPGGSCYTIVA